MKAKLSAAFLALALFCVLPASAQEKDFRHPDPDTLMAFVEYYGLQSDLTTNYPSYHHYKYITVQKLGSYQMLNILKQILPYTPGDKVKLSKKDAEEWKRCYKRWQQDIAKAEQARLAKEQKEREERARMQAAHDEFQRIVDEGWEKSSIYRALKTYETADIRPQAVDESPEYQWLRQYFSDKDIISNFSPYYFGVASAESNSPQAKSGEMTLKEAHRHLNGIDYKSLKYETGDDVVNDAKINKIHRAMFYEITNTMDRQQYWMAVHKEPEYEEFTQHHREETARLLTRYFEVEKAGDAVGGLGALFQPGAKLPEYVRRARTLMEQPDGAHQGTLTYDSWGRNSKITFPYKTINGRTVVDGVVHYTCNNTQYPNATGSNYLRETYKVDIKLTVRAGKAVSINFSGTKQYWMPNIHILKNYRTELEQNIALSRAKPIVDKTVPIRTANDLPVSLDHFLYYHCHLVENHALPEREADVVKNLIEGFNGTSTFTSNFVKQHAPLMLWPIDVKAVMPK